jgi:hypothetical protein
VGSLLIFKPIRKRVCRTWQWIDHVDYLTFRRQESESAGNNLISVTPSARQRGSYRRSTGHAGL